MKRYIHTSLRSSWIRAAQLAVVIVAAAIVPTVAQTPVTIRIDPSPVNLEQLSRVMGRNTAQFHERISDGRSVWFGSPSAFRLNGWPSAAPGRSNFAPLNSSDGFISTSNPWNTSDSAFFPNGITTAGATNWIYGSTTFIGNAPANGFGHQFNASAGSSHVYLAIGGGNVGIGTTGPSARLQVAGPIYSSSAQTDSVFSGTITASNANYVGTEGYWALRSATNNSYNLDVYNSASPITAMTVMQNGNVGIGTTTPAGPLDVAMSDATFSMFKSKSSTPTTGTGLLLYGRTAASAPAGQPLFWHFGVRYDGGGGSWPAGALGVYDIVSNGAGGSAGVKNFMFFDPAGHTVFNPSSGNVGIGTITPGYKLDVNGEINATGVRINGTPISTGGGSQWSGSGSIYYNGGNVGIGITSPSYKLDVNGTIQASTFRLANGFEMQQGAGNYGQFNSWVHLNGYHGFYSSLNGAHIYPNNASYGAWRIDGTRNGYGGINYNGKTVLMMQDDLIGLYNEYYGKWILYGNGSTGNTIISPNGGNVGIGTTDAGAYKLNVNGEVNATGFRINGTPISSGGGSQWTDGSGSISYSGNVGIGTPTPGTKLQVNGDIFTNGGEARLALTQNDTATRLLSYNNANSLWMLQPNTQRFVLADGLDWDRSLNFEYTAGATGAQAGVLSIGQLSKNSANFTHGTTSLYTNGAERLRINSLGSVGIGTSSPHRTLDLSTSGQLTFGDNGYSSTGSPGMFWYSDNINYGIYKSAGSWSGPNYQQLVLNFDTGIVINGGSAYGKSGTVLQPNGGNVGIGTTTPAQKLSVAGVVQSTTGGFMFPDGTTQTTAASGSGSATPANIPAGEFGANTSGGTYAFPSIVNVNGGSSSNWGTLNIGGNDSINAAGNIYSYSRICAGNNWGNCASPNGGVVLANSGSNTYGNVYLTGSGNSYFNGGYVGIGKTNPTVALDVVGDIKASGVIHTKYQDVAEWVESSEKLAAGTVVVLDSTKSNQVVSSSQAYDTRVAGVISAQPGIMMGEQSESKVLVATTGRVKIKVDATKSPIQIGDLLVTSDVPGVAMKSEPVEFAGRKMHMPGTLIGKALEPLAKGKGEILVLLSLQ